MYMLLLVRYFEKSKNQKRVYGTPLFLRRLVQFSVLTLVLGMYTANILCFADLETTAILVCIDKYMLVLEIIYYAEDEGRLSLTFLPCCFYLKDTLKNSVSLLNYGLWKSIWLYLCEGC